MSADDFMALVEAARSEVERELYALRKGRDGANDATTQAQVDVDTLPITRRKRKRAGEQKAKGGGRG